MSMNQPTKLQRRSELFAFAIIRARAISEQAALCNNASVCGYSWKELSVEVVAFGFWIWR